VRSEELGDRIFLNVAAGSGDSINPEFGTASADPIIFIDPSFAGASQYSVIVSDGVGNGVGSVPEPGTVGLVLSAALFLWVARARSRRELNLDQAVPSAARYRFTSWAFRRLPIRLIVLEEGLKHVSPIAS